MYTHIVPHVFESQAYGVSGDVINYAYTWNDMPRINTFPTQSLYGY